MNLVIWNVRGLNKSPHQKEVTNFIDSNKLDLMCCVETKVKISQAFTISKKIKKNWQWIYNYD